MTPAQQDACAAWWYGVLTDIRQQMAAAGQAGGDGWGDLQAKLAVLRMYEQAVDIERHILGRVVQRLAHACGDPARLGRRLATLTRRQSARPSRGRTGANHAG